MRYDTEELNNAPVSGANSMSVITGTITGGMQ